MHNRRIGYIRIQGKKDVDSLHMDGNLHAIFTDKAEKNNDRCPQLKAALEQANELKKRATAGEDKTLLARDFAISKEALHAYLRTDRKNLDA